MTRRFLAILTLAALLPACAHGSSGGSGANPRTITVDRTDAGRVIAMHAGDRLLISLDTSTSMQWRVLSYPKDLLRSDAAYAGQGRFDFTATATGTGRIALVMQPACGKSGGPPCSPSDYPVDGVAGMPPTRPVTFDISVN